MRKTLLISTILFLLLFVGLSQAVQINEIIRWRFFLFDSHSERDRPYKLDFITNIDPRINFYTQDGYSLNSELCQGQKFKVAVGPPSGEWVGEGGYYNSPPITWVDDITIIAEGMRSHPGITRSEIYDGYDGWSDIPLHKIGGHYMTVVCESLNLENLKITGAYQPSKEETILLFTKATFIVTATDKVDISADNIKCVFYFLQGCVLDNTPNMNECKYMTQKLEERNLGPVLEGKSFKVTKPEPSIKIKPMLTNSELSPQSSTYLKLVVTNNGNTIVSIKDIDLNVNSEFLACTSMKLSPEETTECVLSVSPEQSFVIEANVKYQFQMCGERQEKTERFLVGYIEVEATECSSSSDCSENYECCKGLCYDSTKGMCVDVNADGVPEWVPIE